MPRPAEASGAGIFDAASSDQHIRILLFGIFLAERSARSGFVASGRDRLSIRKKSVRALPSAFQMRASVAELRHPRLTINHHPSTVHINPSRPSRSSVHKPIRACLAVASWRRQVHSRQNPNNESSTESRKLRAALDALQAQVDALKRLQAEAAAELDALSPSILDRAFKGEL